MKVLVTGGTGFIGGRFAEKIKNNHEVEIYDLPKDILDKKQMIDAIQRNDIVVHFAALADINKCQQALDETFLINVKGVFQIAKFCIKFDKPIIYISTCCVYGNSLDDEALEYKTNYQCNEPYSTSKLAGEAVVKGMPNLKYMILRIGTVYGPGQREALFTHIVLDKILNNKEISVHGDGLQNRQIIFIDDLVDGIISALNNFNTLNNKQIFNLCGKEKISALDCIKIAEKIIGKHATFRHVAQRYGNTLRENISIKRAEEMLGWKPKISFEEGMKLTLENDKRYGSGFTENK